MASFGASNTSSSNEYYISPTQWNTTTTYTNFDTLDTVYNTFFSNTYVFDYSSIDGSGNIYNGNQIIGHFDFGNNDIKVNNDYDKTVHAIWMNYFTFPRKGFEREKFISDIFEYLEDEYLNTQDIQKFIDSLNENSLMLLLEKVTSNYNFKDYSIKLKNGKTYLIIDLLDNKADSVVPDYGFKVNLTGYSNSIYEYFVRRMEREAGNDEE